MGYVIAFAIGAVLGSAIFCVGVIIGKPEKQLEEPMQVETPVQEKPMTAEEKADLDRRNELERQFVALMEYSGRKRQ